MQPGRQRQLRQAEDCGREFLGLLQHAQIVRDKRPPNFLLKFQAHRIDDGRCHFIARHIVETNVVKHNCVTVHHGEIVVPWLLARYAAHLKYVHEVGFIGQLNVEFELVEIEIFKTGIKDPVLETTVS